MRGMWMGAIAALLVVGCREDRNQGPGNERNQPGTLTPGVNAPGPRGSAGTGTGSTGAGMQEPGGGTLFHGLDGGSEGIGRRDAGAMDAGAMDAGARGPGAERTENDVPR